MSKSYLGRAIIELGRSGSDKFQRRQRAKGARRWTLDEEGEYEPGPRKGEGRELRDHLQPLERWLDSKVGKSWARIYSEFCQQVDRRSIMGDHILGHMRQMVKGSGGAEYLYVYDPSYKPPCYAIHGYYSLFVDGRGILRKHTSDDCEAYGRKVGWKRQPYEPYVDPNSRWEIEAKARRAKREKVQTEKERMAEVLKERNRLLHPTLADQANLVKAPV